MRVQGGGARRAQRRAVGRGHGRSTGTRASARWAIRPDRMHTSATLSPTARTWLSWIREPALEARTAESTRSIKRKPTLRVGCCTGSRFRQEFESVAQQAWNALTRPLADATSLHARTSIRRVRCPRGLRDVPMQRHGLAHVQPRTHRASSPFELTDGLTNADCYRIPLSRRSPAYRAKCGAEKRPKQSRTTRAPSAPQVQGPRAIAPQPVRACPKSFEKGGILE